MEGFGAVVWGEVRGAWCRLYGLFDGEEGYGEENGIVVCGFVFLFVMLWYFDIVFILVCCGCAGRGGVVVVVLLGECGVSRRFNSNLRHLGSFSNGTIASRILLKGSFQLL